MTLADQNQSSLDNEFATDVEVAAAAAAEAGTVDADDFCEVDINIGYEEHGGLDVKVQQDEDCDAFSDIEGLDVNTSATFSDGSDISIDLAE